MRRLSPSLIALATPVAVIALGRLAWAQTAPQHDVAACAPIQRQLDETRRQLDAVHEDAQNAHRDADGCSTREASTNEALSKAASAEQTCKESNARQCAATSAVIEDVLRDHVPGAASAACVSQDQQQRLESLLKDWTGARSALGRLGAYAEGETDWLPLPPGGTTALDRLVQRMAGGEPRTPLAYRRLLVEAMRLVAPVSWRKIRERGPAPLDAWFSGRDALSADLVDEARLASQSTVGPAGPPLSAALRLVLAYELLAGCTPTDARATSCTRARQLQQVLESTGPLIVRRRIEDIWATDCAATSPAVVLGFLAGFSVSQGGTQPSGYGEVTHAAYAKLYSCYLGDASADASFGAWLEGKLPGPKDLTGDQLARLDEIRAYRSGADAEDACARAVRALQRMPNSSSCTAPESTDREALEEWTSLAATPPAASRDTMRICRQYARLLWQGEPATIAGAFARPPSIEDMVSLDARQPASAMAHLRALCADRRGTLASFPEAIRSLGILARSFGESTDTAPWRIAPESGGPVELPLFEHADRARPWLEHLFWRAPPCEALNLADARCTECSTLPTDAAYDCTLLRRLDAAWARRTRGLFGALVLAALAAAFIAWGRRMLRARARFADWAREAAGHLEGVGLPVHRDPARYLSPSRQNVLLARLPHEAAWERWGTRAVVARVPGGSPLSGRDIDHAAQVAYRAGAAVGIVVHDDDATPDLSAVRAILEWAARGGKHAVQIVAVSSSRLLWAKSAHDVLDLVEETTLRGDPFDLRGRITSSSQFFNRERLVSGLLAAAQGGRWQVITGLRRFGKSSLALEVARRLPGPSAYVDLSALHHEIGAMGDPSRAADAILRYVCLRATESARARYGETEMPEPFSYGDRIDATALATWFATLSRACRAKTGGQQPRVLVVLDEIEQVLAVEPQRIGHALEVLAIAVGRLKGALGEEPGQSASVAVFLCSAPHSLLWAPLGALAGQSIMGTFPSLCVPCLSGDAAGSMMRSLGLRHGIRFSEAALDQMIAASHGIPLLLRRIGSSVLELYDPERARHGGLGAVDVGPEGAREAIERETREGSPVRVWVDSEICDRTSPMGTMLRTLAREGRVDVTTLRGVAGRVVARDFASTGMDRSLGPEESARRVEEAAGVLVRLLGETGLLMPVGDLTSPEAYDLPDGAIPGALRVLRPSPHVGNSPNLEGGTASSSTRTT